MDLSAKTDGELGQWIKNHEGRAGGTQQPLYCELLEERARRGQAKRKLNLERSLEHLKQAAIQQACTTYGQLAKASGVEWSQARVQMNGNGGHLERLLDLCHARSFPLLTAICVNQGGLAKGELEAEALVGFTTGARRLGFLVTDERAFHHRCRDECWRWGSEQNGAG